MLDLEPTGAGGNDAAAPTDTPAVNKAAKKATAKKSVKKATKKAAAKKTTAKKATPAADAGAADAPVAKKATKKAAKKAVKKTAKKAAAKTAAAEVDAAAAGPASATTSAAPRKRASRKKAAAPAFTGTPETADAAAAAAEAAIPSVLFQAPDADAAPVRKRASRAKATPAAASTDADDSAADTATADAGAAASSDESDEDGSPRRRRRRGGRGRRSRGGSADGAEDTQTDDAAESDDTESGSSDADEDGDSGSTRRRRRRRRKGDSDGTTVDDPPNTVTKVRTKRSDEPQGIKGSVRIEAKRQRRREGREAGRRRPPVLTEAEFLARREAVDRVMVVRQIGERTQIAVLEDDVLVEHHVSRETTGSMIGNVYLGRVQNVLPSMEAAFIDIGRGRNAVLYAGEVNWDAAGLEGQPKRIEVALKSGDAVLVQVTKDPVGHKGARLTSQISLPGRYLVYVPDGSMTGISRKLPDTERTRLKSILKRVLPENAGVIVRTASEGASEEELSRDVARLAAQWDDIDSKRGSANAPALLYGEPDLTVRVIRDIFNEDFAKLIVSGAAAWDIVNDYIGHVAPDLHSRVEKWTSEKDVWSEFRIDEQLAKALDRKVWLPSGGSLVIDRTEAMTVVDVNTGKFTGQGGNLEQTVTENNLEAAEEIVRQLRLRDIGGIIVIDFIDMVLESNRDLVLRRLVECLGRDRTKHQVAEVTSLGLVQMTRKRVGEGLIEVFSTTCDSCNGRGVHVQMEPVEGKRQSGESRGPGGGKQRGKSKDETKSSDDASSKSASTSKDEAKPAASDDAGDTDAGSDGDAPRKRRRGRRGSGGQADASAGAGADHAAEVVTASSASTDASPAAPVAQAVESVTTEPATAAPKGSAAGDSAAEAAATPLFAPRGVDLAPEHVSTPAPKRRRRGASRPAGAPEAE